MRGSTTCIHNLLPRICVLSREVSSLESPLREGPLYLNLSENLKPTMCCVLSWSIMCIYVLIEFFVSQVSRLFVLHNTEYCPSCEKKKTSEFNHINNNYIRSSYVLVPLHTWSQDCAVKILCLMFDNYLFQLKLVVMAVFARWL